MAVEAMNYIHSALEKRRVTATFKRYVAPEIVNEILKEGSDALELGGKLTNIAVLFVDVRGFTTMSERLQPKQVAEILNRYLTLIADCILRNGGAQPPLSRPFLNGSVSLPAVTSVPIGVSRLLQNSRSLIRQRA